SLRQADDGEPRALVPQAVAVRTHARADDTAEAGLASGLTRQHSRAMISFEEFLVRHRDWSMRVFGEGRQTAGLTEHIEKELAEIRAKPDDLVEWVDVITLAIDGYLRHGGTVTGLVADLAAKQEVNRGRRWPEP